MTDMIRFSRNPFISSSQPPAFPVEVFDTLLCRRSLRSHAHDRRPGRHSEYLDPHRPHEVLQHAHWTPVPRSERSRCVAARRWRSFAALVRYNNTPAAFTQLPRLLPEGHSPSRLQYHCKRAGLRAVVGAVGFRHLHSRVAVRVGHGRKLRNQKGFGVPTQTPKKC